ncbi:hypothetical protein T492DRAFT_1032630 [Pavlovales sp. CCMP2436]|nr:hypothetical protein T492DRAFT_1032630 [Pavlovales sp. CCMP2436]
MASFFVVFLFAGVGPLLAHGIRPAQPLLAQGLPGCRGWAHASDPRGAHPRARLSVPRLHVGGDDGDLDEDRTPTRNEMDDMGVDFSWDGGTIALVLGIAIAFNFFVLANL